MQHNHFNESQNLLDRNIRGFGYFLLLFFYVVVFCPLWFTGFIIERKMFNHKYEGIKEIIIIVFIAILFYWLLFFLKGILLYWKGIGNLFWIPLYVICTGFAAAWPAIELFLMTRHSLHPVMGGMASIGLFCLIYAHYKFHADTASFLGRPAYHLGISIASKF